MKQSGFGIVSLILGIISIVTVFIAIGIIPAILGVIFAIIGLFHKNRKKEIAILGLILSLTGIIIFALLLRLVNSTDDNDKVENVADVSKVQEYAETDNDDCEDQTLSFDTVTSVEQNKEVEETSDTPHDSVESTEEKKEILFKDILWGTSYTDVDEALSELGIWNLSGEEMKTMSVDDIVLGDYKGIDFEYPDINIIAPAFNGKLDVSGYTTSEVNLYFAYVPVDGVLTKTEDDSALYGAQYIFESKNLLEMSTDLVNKLTSLYGEPSKTKTDSDIWGNQYKYIYWYGANDTELVLKSTDTTNDSTGLYDDKIIISYAWRKGDELLQNASDILKQEAINKESEAYGNNATNGL